MVTYVTNKQYREFYNTHSRFRDFISDFQKAVENENTNEILNDIDKLYKHYPLMWQAYCVRSKTDNKAAEIVRKQFNDKNNNGAIDRTGMFSRKNEGYIKEADLNMDGKLCKEEIELYLNRILKGAGDYTIRNINFNTLKFFKEYNEYFSIGDMKGNKNGVIDSFDEASIAAKEASKKLSYQDYLIFLRALNNSTYLQLPYQNPEEVKGMRYTAIKLWEKDGEACVTSREIANYNRNQIPDKIIPLLIYNLDNDRTFHSTFGGRYGLESVASACAWTALFKTEPRSLPYLKRALLGNDVTIKIAAYQYFIDNYFHNKKGVTDDMIPLIIMSFKFKRTDTNTINHGAMWFNNYSIELLKYLGKRAIPYLNEALMDKDNNIKRWALETLLAISRQNSSIIPNETIQLIIQNLDNKTKIDNVAGYECAIQTLNNIGKRAGSHLKIAINCRNPEVSKRAEQILSKIERK